MTDADPSLGFFEGFYRDAEGDERVIPWASMSPNRFVSSWLKEQDGTGLKALVVGCGLGDDAQAIADAGWSVTAFDIAPSAIQWCRERFPASPVDSVVADLFDLPAHWVGAFPLVVEVLTLQSLAPAVRSQAIAAVATLVAPAGHLLVSTIGRADPGDIDGPPWPLARGELDQFCSAGLDEVSVIARPSTWEGFDVFEAEYRRPLL